MDVHRRQLLRFLASAAHLHLLQAGTVQVPSLLAMNHHPSPQQRRRAGGPPPSRETRQRAQLSRCKSGSNEDINEKMDIEAVDAGRVLPINGRLRVLDRAIALNRVSGHACASGRPASSRELANLFAQRESSYLIPSLTDNLVVTMVFRTEYRD